MNITIPLYPGTTLAHIHYYWIVAGVRQADLTSGISQPDANFPMFVFSVTPPANADEIIAYDTTNLANWNAGNYKIALEAAGLPVPPPTVIPPPTFAPPTLRTVVFRDVYESILRRHGFDPVGDAVSHDTLRAIVRHINKWIRFAWRYWEWPDFELLENRAFRTVWTNTLQFYRVGFEGNPDELYNPTDQNYYRVNAAAPSDPPVGTPPTNTTYFTQFTLTDRYILLDQVGQTPIGEVIEIFAADPRLDAYHYARRIKYQPTERQCTVIGYPGDTPTVWVDFRIRPSQFTGIPYVVGHTYNLGDLIYHPPAGECYLAAIPSPTGDPTAQPAQWIKVPFPEIFDGYITAKAYAAGLNETNTWEKDANALGNFRQLQQAADQEAQDQLDAEVNRLMGMGQRYRYPRWRHPYDAWHWWSYPAVSSGAK